MGELNIKYFKNMDLNEPSTESDLTKTEKEMVFIFPDDYRDFILKYNGAEGSIGNSEYLVLWSLQEISKFNEAYLAREYVPKLILIGDNGGDEAYAYDSRSDCKSIVSIPFSTMNYEDVVKIADNFTDFLQYLYEQE